MIRITHITLFTLLAVACLADDKFRSITWETLSPKVEFEDPFANLETEQLMNLGMIARIRGLMKRPDKRVSDAMKQEMADAEAALKKQGVDIEGLFARREEITEKRKARAHAAATELDEVQVKLSGFVLPLEFKDKKVIEFLLVPWVGACIHTPPPPPNQMVLVIPAEGFETNGTFEPITIMGPLKIKKTTQKLFLVDGTSEINVSYRMQARVVEKYKRPKSKPE
jgi:hypothetical protein